ncbi:MAG: ABC transporter substrate-binding protein [Alphaproteobacteria bacterium]|nr:ABC transporter substrate-binding protein [Alphaproteobacteria bacterium]
MGKVRIGFIPLVDCALIAVACELGLAERRGVRLVPSREPSWTAIRDKIAFGLLDAAQMLAPMPIAMTLGLGGLRVPMVAPMTLGLGGNAVTVSSALYDEMCAADPEAMAGPRILSARAVAQVARARRAARRPRLRFASVFPFSTHLYELRLWLAGGGVDPDGDVNIVVIPPPRMVENMASGLVDGFCVGEPWNQLAVSEGLGRIVAVKADIAPDAPEKVLGLRRDWSEDNRQTVHTLVQVLAEAAEWSDGHPSELAELLARDEWVGASPSLLLACLEGRPLLVKGEAGADLPTYQTFRDGPVNAPRDTHVAWLIERMTGCGRGSDDVRQAVGAVYGAL